MTQNNTSYESILRQASKKESNPYKLSKTYPAYIVLIVLLIISYFIWDQAKVQVANDRKAEFDKAVSSVMSRLETKFQRKEEIISSMTGLYDILPEVVRDYFDLYGQIPTKTYPSIISIDYVPYVEESAMELFIFNAMNSGYYDYKLKQKSNLDYHYPILHIVPIERNYHRLGIDLSSNDIIKEAIEKARDYNIVTVTPVIEFRDDTTGMFLISPIFFQGKSRNSLSNRRNNFQGTVIIEIESEKYFKNAISGGRTDTDSSFPTDSSIVFQIIDTADGTKNIVFTSKNGDILKNDYEKYVSATVQYRFADRDFLIEFVTIPNFGGDFQKTMPLVALITSLFLSFLFFAFVFSVTTSRARAIDLADRMTRSQRRIVDSSKDIIAVLDFDGNWRSMNPASYDIFGKEPDDMIGNNIKDQFYSDEDAKNYQDLLDKTTNENTDRIDIKMKATDSEFRWLSWNLTISKIEGLIYAIGRDVTLEKKAEEESILRTKQIQLAEQFAREASESKSYFMTKLSHMMRNSLTGMMGYLQLLSNKVYETEEEHDSYVQLAEESTEEVFTFVNDIVDRAIGSDDDETNFELIHLSDLFEELFDSIFKIKTGEVTINREDSIFNAKAFADGQILRKALYEAIEKLLIDSSSGQIQVQASENKYEGATEIQLLLPVTELTDKMINVFKDSKDHIQALKDDYKDIILTLARSASDIRRMNGTFTLDSFGPKDSCLLQITLPLNKTQIED